MLLRKKNKELTAVVDTGEASSGSSTDLAADDIARSSDALADGRFDVTPMSRDPMSEAMRHLTPRLSAQAFGQLRHTVVFSSQAGEAMAALSFVAGDVSGQANQTQRAIESGLACVAAASTSVDQIEATASSPGERAQRMTEAFAALKGPIGRVHKHGRGAVRAGRPDRCPDGVPENGSRFDRSRRAAGTAVVGTAAADIPALPPRHGGSAR